MADLILAVHGVIESDTAERLTLSLFQSQLCFFFF